MLWDRYRQSKEKKEKEEEKKKDRFREFLNKRIAYEVRNVKMDNVEVVFEDEKKLDEFKVKIRIDEYSYWSGGVFWFKFNFTEKYPYTPPKVRAITTIYHPSISFSGHINLNILQDSWSPLIDLKTLIRGLIHLFLSPNFDDPMNPSVSQTFFRSQSEFLSNVQTSLKDGKINSIDFSQDCLSNTPPN